MLEFGDVFGNILTVAIIFGLGYIIYLKAKQKGMDYSPFRNLFSKAKEIVQKTNIKK
jgi:hypothetical protein